MPNAERYGYHKEYEVLQSQNVLDIENYMNILAKKGFEKTYFGPNGDSGFITVLMERRVWGLLTDEESPDRKSVV